MNKSRTILLLIAAVIIGALVGFFIGKLVYQTEQVVKTEVKVDTVYQDKPVPYKVDSLVTKWYPVTVHDTTYSQSIKIVYKDSVPNIVIHRTQNQYHKSDVYDAWVSGVEPSLDSIKVYNKTVINNVLQKPARLGVVLGANYLFTSNNAVQLNAALRYRVCDYVFIKGGYHYQFYPNSDTKSLYGPYIGIELNFLHK